MSRSTRGRNLRRSFDLRSCEVGVARPVLDVNARAVRYSMEGISLESSPASSAATRMHCIAYCCTWSCLHSALRSS